MKNEYLNFKGSTHFTRLTGDGFYSLSGFGELEINGISDFVAEVNKVTDFNSVTVRDDNINVKLIGFDILCNEVKPLKNEPKIRVNTRLNLMLRHFYRLSTMQAQQQVIS
jgi:hypothetical protein